MNPSRRAGTPLPPHLLTMAKVVALAALFHPPDAGRWLQAALVLCAAALLLNRWARVSAVALGAVLGVGGEWVAGSVAALAALPHTALIRTAHPAALWAAVLLLGTPPLLRGAEYTLAAYALLAATFAFAGRPKRILAIYDGACGFCRKSRRAGQLLDVDGMVDWQPLQSGAGDAYGISREQLARRLYAVRDDGRIAAGFRAFQWMLLYSPLPWLAATAVLAASPVPLQRWVAGALLAFFFPAFRPAGDALYEWIARNRHRLSRGGSCRIAP